MAEINIETEKVFILRLNLEEFHFLKELLGVQSNNSIVALGLSPELNDSLYGTLCEGVKRND